METSREMVASALPWQGPAQPDQKVVEQPLEVQMHGFYHLATPNAS